MNKKSVVAIDCFKLVKGFGKSIGIYNVALSLIKCLASEQKKTSNTVIINTRVIVLGNKYNRDDFDIDGIEFIEISLLNPLNKIHCVMWELFGVSVKCKEVCADKVVFPRGYVPLIHNCYEIVMIHDLIPFYYAEHFPGVFNKMENGYIMRRLKKSAQRANEIITISEASKEEILKYCKVTDEKIKVIYNACSALKINWKKEKKERPYIFAMTSSLPHKNALGIFEGYLKYYTKCKQPYDLVVVGVDACDKYITDEKISNHIRCYKYLKNNQELYNYIANSEMFLFLSLIEGFGLPPIEAMQLNVPVICSNRSSLPEVVADAAILVDPEKYSDIADALIDLQFDEEKRRLLIKNGKKNVERFTAESRAKFIMNP